MISSKICMLGAFAVGKTSLVRRYVDSIFDDKYQTTIGVKISKHALTVDNEQMQLLLWDIEGKDTFTDVNTSYLRGAAGVVLVADGTRPQSIDDLIEIHSTIHEHILNIPVVIMLNKKDLIDNWQVNTTKLEIIKDAGWVLFETSAKTGEGVEESFYKLAEDILAKRT